MKGKKEAFYPSLCSPICSLLAFQQMEANKTIISNIRLGAAFVYRNDTELHAVLYIYTDLIHTRMRISFHHFSALFIKDRELMIKKETDHLLCRLLSTQGREGVQFSALGLGTDGPKCNDYKIPTFKIV